MAIRGVRRYHLPVLRASRRPAPSSAAALAAAAVALALGACSRGPPPVHVETIRIAQGAVAEPLREAGLEERDLEAAARDALSGAGFRLSAGERRFRARLDVVGVRIVPARDGSPQVEVAIELELAPAQPGEVAVRETGVGAERLAGAPGAAWKAALAGATRAAAEGLAIGFRQAAKPVEALLADLEDDDPRVRLHAMRVLAERRSGAAVPALVAALHDPDRTVRQRAIGALAQIGDPRAVRPLIEASRRGDADQAARLARIIGDLGGEDAEGHLLLLAAAHPDPRVRRVADDTYTELLARRAAAPPVAGR